MIVLQQLKKGENMNEVEFFEEYKIEIDDVKKNIMNIHNNHVLVKGKAGNGKSTLLLSRIAYLIKCDEVNPAAMLNIVFDEDNAKLMAKRYRYYFCDDEIMPSFIELHNFCYGIIKRNDAEIKKESWKAYKDLSKVIKKLVRDMFAIDLMEDDMKRLMQKISYCKNMMLSEHDIAKETFPNLDFNAFYKAYEKFKTTRKIYDYDDLLVHAGKILMSNTAILQFYQEKFQYIHIDEAQELSFLSHMIIKLVSGTNAQLFALADFDQSIALDRCAYQEALVTFTDTYKDAIVVELKENYRCNKSIVELANTFMFTNQEGLVTQKEDTCEVKFKGFSEVSRLYEYALRKVQEDEEETAFLYHDFSMAIPLIEMFKENGVSFSFQGTIKNFFQNRIVNDLFNFIQLFINAKDFEAFAQVQDKLNLDIPAKVLLEIEERIRRDDQIDVYQALMDSGLRAVSKKKLSSNMENIRSASYKDSFDMIEFIMDKLNYKLYLNKNRVSMTYSYIIAFKVLADRYRDPAVFVEKMKELLEFKGEPTSRISIRSIGRSKGHEYGRVCLIDCVNGLFPRLNISEEEMQRERRLFYVAITRAIHDLEFFTFKRAFQSRMEISPFIYEIYKREENDDEPVKAAPQVKKLREGNLKRGQNIIHKTLGKGKITKVSEGMMSVQFETEVKTLNVKLCLANKLIEIA